MHQSNNNSQQNSSVASNNAQVSSSDFNVEKLQNELNNMINKTFQRGAPENKSIMSNSDKNECARQNMSGGTVGAFRKVQVV